MYLYFIFTNIFLSKKLEYSLAPFRHILSYIHIIQQFISLLNFDSETFHLEMDHSFHNSGNMTKNYMYKIIMRLYHSIEGDIILH
jgi:hypothetical protein